MTEQQKVLAQLLATASPGPWDCDEDGQIFSASSPGKLYGILLPPANAKFVCACRNYCSDILVEIQPLDIPGYVRDLQGDTADLARRYHLLLEENKQLREIVRCNPYPGAML